MKIKVEKNSSYLVTFTHHMDDKDVIQETVEGRYIFRLRNLLSDLGYILTSYELI